MNQISKFVSTSEKTALIESTFLAQAAWKREAGEGGRLYVWGKEDRAVAKGGGSPPPHTHTQ